MNKKKNVLFMVVLLVSTAILVAFDQWIKHLAVIKLKGQNPFNLISGVLELQYLENHGAAFGMLQNQQWFFWILTGAFILVAIWYFLRVPKTAYYMPMIICVTFLFAGAIGNFIDRIAYRYVVDFIYFSLINFPIFNVADIYVSCSVCVLVLLVLFRYKDNDFAFLTEKK